MNKLFIKGAKVCLLLFAAFQAINASAQQEGVDLPIDSLNITKQIEPGYLLKINKLNSTSSVSTVWGETLYKTPQANLTNTLYNRLAGLTVSQNTGEPGYDAASLSIRGIGTYDNAALKVYVDGFESTMNYLQFISASEIESISVLKDAAALAPFGMKGGNGILWVTTKRGDVSKRTITVGLRTGFQQPVNLNTPLNSYDFANLYNQANSNDNNRTWTPKYSDAQLSAYNDGTGVNTNWYQQALRTSSPLSTDADVTIKGGDPVIKYAVMMNYGKIEGLANVPTNERTSNEQLQKYNLRTNIDINLFKIVEAKIDLSGRIEDRRYPNYNGGELFTDLASYPTNIYPVKDAATGFWSGTAIYPNNPVASINALGWSRTHDRVLTANFNLKERLDFIIKGLYFAQSASFHTYTQTGSTIKSTYARYFNGLQTTTDINSDISATAETPTNQYDWKQFTLSVGYNGQFGKSKLSTAINFLRSSYYSETSSSLSNNENLGGRLNYTFDNRYVAELGFAYSGCDNYAPNNNWGFYPAVSSAWIVSNEAFLKNSTFINLLKFRVSAGKVGNSNTYTGRYNYQLYYKSTNGFTIGDTKQTINGLVQSYAPNPDVFAEQSLKYNIGIDAKLFKKLDISLDAFVDKRSGIVTLDNSYSALFGSSVPYANVGRVTNKGFELTATYQDKIGNLGYFVTGIASYVKNNIDYNAEVPPVFDYNGYSGRPIGTVLGLINEEFYQLEDFNVDGTLKAELPVPAFGAVQPGDLKYKDMNDDKKIDQNDRTKIGESGFPTLTYSLNIGLNFKNFDFQVLAQGSANRMVNLLNNWNQTVAFVDNGNAYAIAKGAWAYYPDQNIDTRLKATYPRLTTLSNANNYQNSTFWERSADFIRIRNLELGYSLPKVLLNKALISNLRFYVNVLNPFTFSSFMKENNLDPEVLSGYPSLKSYTVGLIISL